MTRPFKLLKSELPKELETKTPLKTQVYQYIESHPKQSSTQIATLFPSSGTRNIYLIIQNLANIGLIVKEPCPCGSNTLWSIKK